MSIDTDKLKPDRFYVTSGYPDYVVVDMYNPDWQATYSTHPTKEEAEAVALALNALSK